MYLSRFQEAIDMLTKVIKINPKIPDAYFYLALCFENLKDYDIALQNYYQAVSINPNYHQAIINYGVLLKNLGRYEDGIKIYMEALNFEVNKEEIYINLSELYKLNSNQTLAKKYAEKAVDINDKNILSLNNLGTVLIDEGNIEGAINIYEKCREINPKFFLTHINLGMAYKYSSNYEKAIKAYEAALKINPNSHETYFNIAKIQLSQNNFENGWKNYEHRWERLASRTIKLNFNKPYWSPKLGYRRLMVWADQPIGEQILFATILKDLIEKFEEVILMVDDRLCSLFEKHYPQIKVLKTSQMANEDLFDYHIPFRSLGLFFRRSIDDFKPSNRIFKLKNIIKNKKNSRFRCALSWKSKNPSAGFTKSVSLDNLLPILKLKNIDFYNIQYSDEDEEVELFYKKHNIQIKRIKDLDTFNDIEGLVNFINSCDFTITVSNTNAHLSASIGKLTYLLLPAEMGRFWWWDNEINGQNVWYPSIRKYNQKNRLDWEDPINQLKDDIEELIKNFT